MNILLFFLLLWFTRLEDWRDGNLRFHSTEPLPSPSLSLKFLSVQIARRRLLSRRSPVVRRPAFPAPADPLQLSLSPALPAPPDSVVCRRRFPLRQILSSSLSLRRFSSLRRFPLRQIRSPFSLPFSLGDQPPLSSDRSRLSPALSLADLLSGRYFLFLSFFFFFFCKCFLRF